MPPVRDVLGQDRGARREDPGLLIRVGERAGTLMPAARRGFGHDHPTAGMQSVAEHSVFAPADAEGRQGTEFGEQVGVDPEGRPDHDPPFITTAGKKPIGAAQVLLDPPVRLTGTGVEQVGERPGPRRMGDLPEAEVVDVDKRARAQRDRVGRAVLPAGMRLEMAAVGEHIRVEKHDHVAACDRSPHRTRATGAEASPGQTHDDALPRERMGWQVNGRIRPIVDDEHLGERRRVGLLRETRDGAFKRRLIVAAWDDDRQRQRRCPLPQAGRVEEIPAVAGNRCARTVSGARDARNVGGLRREHAADASRPPAAPNGPAPLRPACLPSRHRGFTPSTPAPRSLSTRRLEPSSMTMTDLGEPQTDGHRPARTTVPAAVPVGGPPAASPPGRPALPGPPGLRAALRRARIRVRRVRGDWVILADTNARAALGRRALRPLPRLWRALAGSRLHTVTLEDLSALHDIADGSVHGHVVIVAEAEPELARLAPLAGAAGRTWSVTLALLSPDRRDRAAPVLQRPVPAAEAVFVGRVRGGRILHVRAAVPTAAVRVLSATQSADALARGQGASGLQVAALGTAGLAWAPGDPRAAPLDAGALGDVQQRAGRSLDVLFVDVLDPADPTSAQIEALTAEAEELGAAVLPVDPTSGSLRTPPGLLPAEATLPPVDLAVCNPMGFSAARRPRFAAIPSCADADLEQARPLLPRAGDDPAPAGLERLTHTPHTPMSLRTLDTLRGALGVIDLAAWHARPHLRARLLTQLAAGGVPLAADRLDRETHDLLGADLASALRVNPAVLTEPVARERVSVIQRRAALDTHSPATRWRMLREALGIPTRGPLSVSVLLATNRPDHLMHAAGQLAAQDHPNFEVVLALHGDGFPAAAVTRFLDTVAAPTTVLRRPAEDTLGGCLNAATEAASGELVTKVDDDDWYGPAHLRDLELAWRYAGATLVGKAAEFVYFTELDRTIRRFAGGAETWNDLIAGGAMLLSRGDLLDAGGWRRARRAVDRLLINDVRMAGGEVYRTHGFGFVLTRREASSHTWDAHPQYFLSQASAQRDGLDRVFTGLDDRTDLCGD